MSNKLTVLQRLDEITGTRRMTMFVVWYCTPKDEQEPFEEFFRKNINSVKIPKWDYVRENWLCDERILAGIRYYMKLQHTVKMKNIYDKMCEQALNGDVQSAKYLVDFAKDFFPDDKKSELDELLSGLELEDDEDEEEKE